MASAIISTIVVAASLPFFTFPRSLSTGEDATLARVFNDPIRTITIENLAGATEVRTWPGLAVSVAASRASSPDNSRLQAEVLFEQPAGDSLKIVTNPDSLFRPITLTVHVPTSAQLSVRGGTARVSIRGQTASLSVETHSGSVTIYLPEKSNTDLSLRTIRGVIESRLPVTIFGQSDAHLLDGKLGTGGTPVIARSQRGNITVLPEAGSRTASVSQASDILGKRDLSSSDANASELKV